MSLRGKKAGLVISWHKTFSILAPWKKGKDNRHAVLDSEVVLTKIKLLSNFHERLHTADDCDTTRASELQVEASDTMSAIFPDSQLTRLYKFESEDSGVELPSGANSPSTPTGSEQSFVVHSRESSCDSGNLKTDSTTLTDKLVTYAQSSEVNQVLDLLDEGTAQNTEDDSLPTPKELSSPAVREELNDVSGGDRDQCKAAGISSEGGEETSGQLEESNAVSERICPQHRRHFGKQSSGVCDDAADNQFEPPHVRRSATSESLEEYMDQCCRLSESQHEGSNPLGSGLGYLQHICQLIEKIGQLQETNLQLQRQICSLQKSGRMTKTKEDFFMQHCSCGAASVAFQDVHKRHSRSGFLSPCGTLSDLTTIPEASQHGLISTRREMSSEALTPVPLWRRGLNRRSYTEGEAHFLGDSTEGLSIPQRRLSESYTWGRVRDLVRKTKSRNPSRLGLISPSLKMSCPQLYMPDLGKVEPACRQRNSMIALSHDSKFDFPWQQ